MIILDTNVLDTHVTIAKDRYYWPSMYRDTETYVTTCVRCQKNQSRLKSPTTPLKPLPIITKVWYRVGMEVTEPLIESNGYKYILTNIFCRQGAPVRIITDNGTEFTHCTKPMTPS